MMKTFNKLMILAFATAAMTACSELKNDDHYGDTYTTISNPELKMVNESSESYIASRTDLSSMNALFAREGIFDELSEKGQLSTILVVTNDHFVQPEEKVNFVTRSHVSDMSVSPANLHDGDRLMMWHGKYVNVSMDAEGQEGIIIDHLMFNNAHVKEVIKTDNGWVYVIDEMINTPTSLRDYIDNLGDEYSIFKELINASGGKEFDRANSKAIGINEEGNTVYDSVFIYTNKFFEDQGFDMNSESLTATMLLYSNDAINATMSEAKLRLAKWGLERQDSLMKDWILKTAFFNKRYKPEEMSSTEENALISIFRTLWRTDIQKVDTENPIELSNGTVYKVTNARLPNNFLIYRLKGHFYLYENCSAEQKEAYFKCSNMKFNEVKNGSAANNGIYWDPAPGIVPMIPNRIVKFGVGDEGDEFGLRLEFTPLRFNKKDEVEVFMIPPGAYRLAMGFEQNMTVTPTVAIVVNGEQLGKSDPMQCVGTTAYHYDRGTTLSNRYPEWYKAGEPPYNFSKNGNYDTDGGAAIDEVVIPDLNGDGSPVQITLVIAADKWNAGTLVLHHWCLRPTDKNY